MQYHYQVMEVLVITCDVGEMSKAVESQQLNGYNIISSGPLQDETGIDPTQFQIVAMRPMANTSVSEYLRGSA